VRRDRHEAEENDEDRMRLRTRIGDGGAKKYIGSRRRLAGFLQAALLAVAAVGHFRGVGQRPHHRAHLAAVAAADGVHDVVKGGAAAEVVGHGSRAVGLAARM